MALKLSLLLQAVDRISGPARRARDSVRDMGRGVDRAGRDVDRAGSRMGRFGTRARALAQRIRAVAQRARDSARGMDLWGRALDRAGFATGRLIRKVADLGVGMAKWGATAAIAAGGFAIFDMFRVAGEFEQIEIALEGMMGSSLAAKKAMAWIKTLAQETPYQLQEVAQAFRDVKGLGLDPTDGTLRTLGDATSGTAKALENGAAALGDAMRMEFERLREFNIVAQQSGDEVTLSYIKNGKRIERTAKKTELAVKALVLESFAELYGGGMVRQSKSFLGILNSVGDKWTEFQLRVADAGIFELVKSKLVGLFGKLNAMAEDGRLARWAETISDKLEIVVNWATSLTEEDFEGFISDLTRMATAAGNLASAVVTVAENIGKVKKGGANITYGVDWLLTGSKAADKNWGRMYPDEKRRKSDYEQRRDRRLNEQARDRVGLNGPKKAVKLPKVKLPGATPANTKIGGYIEFKVSADPGTRVALAKAEPLSRDVPFSIQIARSNWRPA